MSTCDEKKATNHQSLHIIVCCAGTIKENLYLVGWHLPYTPFGYEMKSYKVMTFSNVSNRTSVEEIKGILSVTVVENALIF